MTNKLDREKSFHDQRFGGDDSERLGAAKYYSITKPSTEYYKHIVSGLCKEADLLEYGCGTGDYAFYWSRNGANVTGIDISEEGIKRAKKNAKDNGLNISFYQMNAEQLQFDANSFDVVTGTSIIHHLSLEASYKEISRVLRTGGHAIFFEPLGHNIIINLYRNLTPSQRTEDEHPLLIKDIEAARKYFVDIHLEYFHIFTLLAVPFRKLSFFNRILDGLHFIDRKLLTAFPFLKRYCWIVVMQLHEPRK